MNVKYAVGIPTRGRNEMLAQTLDAVYQQDVPPELVIVVDNNDDEIWWDIVTEDSYPAGMEVKVLCGIGNKSDPSASQQALEYASAKGFNILIKWDDDLVPTSDCLRRLAEGVYDGAVAAGGLYPRPGEERRNRFVGSWRKEVLTGDADERHLQFFEFDKRLAGYFSGRSLYSSFAYDTRAANLIGGFCQDYSRLAFRHETDFSLRLGQLERGLRIDPQAVARHHVASGGTREISEEVREQMARKDQDLFLRRMKSMGIDPGKYWEYEASIREQLVADRNVLGHVSDWSM